MREWRRKTCSFCGRRVRYNEVDEVSGSLLRVTPRGEWLVAFTEHDDSGKTVEIECASCYDAREPDAEWLDYLDRLTMEQLEDDACFDGSRSR